MKTFRNYKVEGEYEDLNELPTSDIITLLAWVNENDEYRGSELHEALLDIVMNLGVVKNRLQNYMPYKMYGYYGKNVVSFVYSDEYLSLDKYIEEMTAEIRESFKKLTLSKITNLQGNVNPFVTSYLQGVLKEANSRVVCKYVQMKYPEMTYHLLKSYVQLRYRTDYEADLDMENAEILRLLKEKNPEKKITVKWDTINHLKKIYGYQPEISINEKRKQYVSLHRNEVRFWKETGACFIEDNDYEQYTFLLKKDFSISETQRTALYQWCLRCKYEGLFDSKDKKIIDIRTNAIEKYGLENPINRVFAAGILSEKGYMKKVRAMYKPYSVMKVYSVVSTFN